MTSMQTFPVSALENGTVIDHIPSGVALQIVQLLVLSDHHREITIGLNLPSDSLGHKDLIKVSEWELSKEKANQVAILAPNATISIIRDYQVSEKFPVSIPETIQGLISCPNPKCITNHEQALTIFHVEKIRNEIQLTCRYCRNRFSQKEINAG